MGNTIGLIPVPGDKPLGEFITNLIQGDKALLSEKIEELLVTLNETREADQPINFAYAKMMNYFAKGISHPDLIHLCAAAMWKIIEESGQDYEGSNGT